MAITIKDVANALGVSPATISLALNNSPMISAATTRKVKEAAYNMGYVRNQYARRLSRGRSGTIALVVPDVENLYFASMIRHVIEQARELGYDVNISMSNENINDEWRIMRRMIAQRCEAILLSPVNAAIATQEYLTYLAASPVPIMFIGARYPSLNIPCVMCDLENGMFDLTEHVIDGGAKKISLLTSNIESETVKMRMEGFNRAMLKHGLTGEFINCDQMTYQSSYERVMAMTELPEALLCINDVTAVGALNAITQRGLRVPQDIKIAGFDNSELTAISIVSVTSVQQNIPEMAKLAVQNAAAMIEGNTGIESVFLPCSLVKRTSTNG